MVSPRLQPQNLLCYKSHAGPLPQPSASHPQLSSVSPPTRLSAISKARLLKCCDASMSFSTSREPTNHELLSAQVWIADMRLLKITILVERLG